MKKEVNGFTILELHDYTCDEVDPYAPSCQDYGKSALGGRIAIVDGGPGALPYIALADGWGEVEADSYIDAGYGECRAYNINESVKLIIHLDQGYEEGATLMDRNASWVDYLRTWNGPDNCDFNELCASFDLGMDPEGQVDADHAGTCKVWEQHCYYQGTLGKPLDGYVTEDGNDEPLIFANAATAQDWIDEQNQGRYLLAHGEADRPKYFIVEA